jgi:hypothetical protein
METLLLPQHMEPDTPSVDVVLADECGIDHAGTERIGSDDVAIDRVGIADGGAAKGGIRYVVMEYLDAIDVETLLENRGALPIGEAIAYALQICEGLSRSFTTASTTCSGVDCGRCRGARD